MKEHIELEFPKSDDIMFRQFNENYENNAIVRSGLATFFLYSEGYKKAAILLFKHYDGSAEQANTLVYPLVFLNRHYLEIKLKEIINGLNLLINDNSKLDAHHRIDDLFNVFKLLYVSVYAPKNEDTIKNAERLIGEFAKIDLDSFAFRYPISKRMEPSHDMTNLDLATFQNTMSKLYNFFDCISLQVENDVDNKQFKRTKKGGGRQRN